MIKKPGNLVRLFFIYYTFIKILFVLPLRGIKKITFNKLQYNRRKLKNGYKK